VTSEVSPVRKALAALILVIALFAAVVVQLTVVNRLPLPGGAAPDLVLLLVAAIAVSTGPVTGAVVGFAGGLALDIAPPAAHYAGQDALVFCLVGYAAARVVRVIWNTTGERDPITTFTVMATAVAAGEAGKAALGMMLSDPDVTRTAVTRVLPTAILYDLLLAPFVYWLVAFVARGAVTWGTPRERAPVPDFGRAGRLAPVFRQASAGAAPKLRLAGTGGSYASPSPVRRVPKLRLTGTGDSYSSPSPVRRVPRLRLTGTGESYASPRAVRRVPKLRLAGTGESYASPSPVRRVPKLRLSAGHAGSSLAASAPSLPGAPLALAGARTPKLNLAASRPRRRAARSAVRTPGKNWLRSTRSPALPAAKRAVRAPSRGWLNSAGPGGLAGGRAGGRTSRRPRGFAGSGRSALSAAVARPARSPEEALAARSAPSGLSALAGAGTPLANRRSPQAGWLRSARATPTGYRQRRTPRSGWLGSASRPRTVIGSGVRGGRGGAFRGARGPRGNWYAASPSGAWLRRGRHPWRRRSKRLLQLVGVTR
jgi:rod shape-determining protein MreD